MPFFASASGIQINGGNFIDNKAGDINIHTTQLTTGQSSDPLIALEYIAQGTSRQLLGVERNEQQIGAARTRPYDVSHRPQILNASTAPSDNVSHQAMIVHSESIRRPEVSFAGRSQVPHLPSFHSIFSAERNEQQIEAVRSQPYDVSHRLQILDRSQTSYHDDRALFAGPSDVPRLPSFRSVFSQLQPNFHHPIVLRPGSMYTSSAGVTNESYRHPESRAIEYPLTGFTSAGTSHNSHPLPADFGREIINQPIFPWDRAHEPKTSINGGTFIGGNVNHTERHGETGLHVLHRAIAGDAFHDSAERYPQPRCHPETRTEMLGKLWNWTCGNHCFTGNASENEEHVGKKILWLYGPAGAGKSAIAQSLCQKLDAEGCLGGAFFFKRGHPSHGSGNKLFSTLAYQLSRCRPDLKRTTLTLTIIVDGLDECNGQEIQQEILQSIGSFMHDSSLPLRFLITSRPEPHIREIFLGVLNNLHCPLNVNQSFEDVRKYLRDEFSRIHRDHHATMARVPGPWPSPEIINNLVNKSSGYFIYASTVIKFIDDKQFRPTERLAVITGVAEPRFGVPFAALDQLYTQILSEVPARPELLKILTVITTKLSFKVLSVTSIEQLLELEPGDVPLVLRGLHSVVELPKDNNEGIFFHHASFPDFLQDSTRAGIFYFGGCQHHTDLSRHIIKAFSYKYGDPSLNRQGYVAW
ncbi:hypothetical protein B0H13DRAFT_1718138 [Mycena leptocephala]|nr:hypothetical protein B0H13DRAFT_1718138 [Mycena leptocephala]